MSKPLAPRAARGVALIEILVALVVTLFGLFALLGLSLKVFQTEAESYQRSQALILTDDMAQRIKANRPNVAAYAAPAASGIGAGIEEDCSGLATGAALDICQWGNLLRGAAATTGGGTNVGAMSDARGCIVVTAPAAGASGPVTTNVVVVWRGAISSATSATAPCVPAGYSVDDGFMRYTSTVVRSGDLDG